jgi:biotin synthetase
MEHNNLVKSILEKTLAGNSLKFAEAKILTDSNITKLSELIQTSNVITRRNFDNKIDMCAIYPAKIGRCSGDCAFCSQSAHHKCNIEIKNIAELNENDILDNAKKLSQLGVSRYALVTSSEYLTDIEFDKIISIFDKIKTNTSIALCASLGALTMERAMRLKQVGVSRYHHNIETSRSYFNKICTTHSYDDKIRTIKIARQSGLEVCCGGIISMGETFEQRLEMAFALKEMDVNCVPINILNPIAGTRLEHQILLDTDDILRTIAIFRLILQDKPLRFAGGRDNALKQNEYLGYIAGINAMIVGNYLTTSGKSVKEEIKNLERMGYY